MSAAACPSCGAPVEFAIGSSAVVVCGYCSTLVARTDRGVEDHGKVAAPIDIGSPLRVGTTGKARGIGFRITGRTQLGHQAGGVWDEWYAAFDDGRWGWLAEAQGRVYLTFRVAADAPPVDTIEVGATLLDGLTVAEIGRAEILSAEGELPWDPEPGGFYAYADLTGPEERFATIDYGEEPPVVYKGSETTYAELGIGLGEVRGRRVAAEKLSCSQCGAPLELVAPDRAERIYCPSCGAGHDVSAGKLAWIGALKKKKPVEPAIPLGSRGTVDGVEYAVAGFMQRAVQFDITYYWTEYLLFSREKGYRWLVHSDDHWSFVTPLRPGDVADSDPTGAPKAVSWNGKRFRLFQDATARVTWVVGEFYWKVEVGETVATADYVAPPEGISKEIAMDGAREIHYSHARSLQAEEVELAFGVRTLPRPSMVGPMQPYEGPRMGREWAVLLALLLVVAMVTGISKARRTLLSAQLDASSAPALEGAPANVRVMFTEPFEVSGRDNVMVQASAPVTNSWLYVAGDLVNDATGRLESFELPIEYYEGIEDGERWHEGKRRKRVYVSRPEKGRYALRIEMQYPEGTTPPPVAILVREGVFRATWFLLALLALSVFPIVAGLRQLTFESQRWKDSAHSPFGQWDGEE